MARTKDITKISDLIPDANNYNKGTEFGSGLIAKSIQKNGLGRSILIDRKGGVIAGNKTLEATVAAGFDESKIRVIQTDGTELIVVQRTDLDLDTRRGKEMALADNATAKANLAWDYEALGADFQSDELEAWGVFADESEGGVLDNRLNSEAKDEEERAAVKKLSESLIVPPFSILDTRQGYWQDRKKHWKILIGENGESREGTLYRGNVSDFVGMKIRDQGTVSILDPVLSEITNFWFGFPGCNSFDPFAGDSVFGYVSSYMGNSFSGIELRKEQSDINNERIKAFKKSRYICDDAQNILNHIELDSQDLLFSCPPYFDLEKYSDLQNDASNQKNYSDFLEILKNAFSGAIKCLRDNRFAVITVGDVRDKMGFYRRFVDDVKDIFCKNGMLLYNEMILVESIGGGALRANQTFLHRKIVKCHQSVLVFYKGDPKKIKSIFPKIEKIQEYESTDVEL